jgi:hypothetical protein
MHLANICLIDLQVSQQRWLTVGAILFFGGAGLLAADSVSATQATWQG